MPTPRSHGGAELQKIPLNLPGGFRGLNTQLEGAVLGFEWATTLNNAVLDRASRISARKGWIRRSNPAAGTGTKRMVELFEFSTHAGVHQLVATDEDATIWISKDSGITWVQDITADDPYMQFVNYKDDCYAFQKGATAYKYTGTGSFVAFDPLTDAGNPDGDTMPLGGIALSAFGRMWAVDSGGTFVQYCGLLDADNWAYTDPASNAGGFDHKNVWEGTDTVQALVEFNGSLVVFGEDNIVIWSDGQGSATGLDPLSMYVVDTIHGVGCIARDSVVEVDGDLWWLSNSGIQHMSRIVEQRSNPMNNLSKHVHDDLMDRVRNTDTRNIHSLYSPEERFVLFSFPDSLNGDETGQLYCFDSRSVMEDGAAPCVGVWDTLVPKCMVRMEESTTILMFVGVAAPETLTRTFTENTAGVYGGYVDPRNDPEVDPVVPYQMQYVSGWSDFASPYIKIPKKFRSIIYTTGSTEASFAIWYDFDQYQAGIYPLNVSTDQNISYWTSPQDPANPPSFYGEVTDGIEWNDTVGEGVEEQVDSNLAAVQAGEYSSAGKPVIAEVPGVGGTGEYIKMGIQARIAGFPFSIQEISLYLKQGRLI